MGYDDEGRVKMLCEDAETIRKAVTNIQDLSGKTDPKSLNQIVRWINVKEDHASNMQKIVSEYFLTQKVKPVNRGEKGFEDYRDSLVEHHKLLRAAMLCKQNADLKIVHDLDHQIEHLAQIYKLS